MKLKKFDNDLQIVYGEVYAPNVLDSHGDYMEEADIRKMAHKFLSNMRGGNVDTNHDNAVIDADVVESFIARKGDPDFIEGSWVAGVHVADKDIWAGVKDGTYNGFSIEGQGQATKTEIEIDVPEFVKGMTEESDGHKHTFKVAFNEDGSFAGGEADESNGHTHLIQKGTATNDTDGHSHRFSYVEGL